MITQANSEHESYVSYKRQKATAMHLRRGSIEVGKFYENVKEKVKIVENLLQAEEGAKQLKPVGKIRRNSHSTAQENFSSRTQLNNYDKTQAQPESQPTIKKYQDEIMSKIRASQLSSYNSRPLQIINPNTQYLPKHEHDYSNKISSVSGKYELKLDVVLGSYETRKQQIDDKIGQLRKYRAVSIADQPMEHVAEQRQQQTPKFAQSLNKTQQLKSQLKPSKLNRGPRWLEFMSALRRQIQLQQRLRTNKHMISQTEKTQILSIISKISPNSHPDIVTLQSQEFDPFFKPQQKSGKPQLELIAKELAEAWQQCESHWKQSLKNRFEVDLLQKIYSELQGQKEKGAVTLKGFVRELGVMLQNQKYLRNRDLFRIYKRIWPFSREKFISELGIRRQITSS